MAVTLTFEEYVMSHFKYPWQRFSAMDPRTPWEDQETIDERAEKLFYHNVDMTIAAGLFGIHAYLHGAYAATNTWHFYKVMQTMQRIGYVARATPVVSLLVGPMALGYAGVSSSAETLATTPGREHEERGLWQIMSQALTGTGPGVGGWNPGY